MSASGATSAAGASPQGVESSSARTRLMGAVPTMLTLLAEGAWVAVAYALFQAAGQEPMTLGPLSFALVAGAGLLVARRFGAGAGRSWPALAVILTATAAAVGWLWSPEVRAGLVSEDPSAALAAHPGGWLAGLAFLRGTAHAQPVSSEATIANLMTLAIPGIAVAFLIGGTIAEPGRAAFHEAGLAATVVFFAAGTLALALARIGQLGGSSGFDWRRNPAWLGLLGALVVGILAVAIPASFALGPLVLLVLGILPIPLFIIGLFVGIDRHALRTLAGVLLVTVAIALLIGLGWGSNALPEIGGSGLGNLPTPPEEAWMTVLAWAIVLVALAAAIAILSALWMRQVLSRGAEDVAEERTIDYGTSERPGRPRRRWLRAPRTSQPTDAPEAYLALIRDLAADEELRRRPDETPAEHARRLRAGGGEARFGAAIDLLAADYELARFGAARLTPGEHRRALARLRRVRSRVRRGAALS